MKNKYKVLLSFLACGIVGFLLGKKSEIESSNEKLRREKIIREEKAEMIKAEEISKFQNDFVFVSEMLKQRDIEIYQKAIDMNNDLLFAISNKINKVKNKSKIREEKEDLLVRSLQYHIYHCETKIWKLKQDFRHNLRHYNYYWYYDMWELFEIYGFSKECECGY
jgi:hypothetical protein